MEAKRQAPRNRTIRVSENATAAYQSRLLRLTAPASVDQLYGRTVCQDLFEAAGFLPAKFVDLLVVDPPYNLDKQFHQSKFDRRSAHEYALWTHRWLQALRRTLKDDASVYICSDWRSSAAVQSVAEQYFFVRNRITWEREKGRGALSNWKNCSEDIWFCTVGRQYTFNVESVKLRRRVIAPYTTENGEPKDWERTERGGFRLTHPSNLWTDLSVPFWSMPENTNHPTQKPEKLVAKLILASSNPGDFVFDPFLGSGTTSVVAKKLGRRFCGIEIDDGFCCLAEKRLEMADVDASIQGYADGTFWERNSFAKQARCRGRNKTAAASPLFDQTSSA